MAKDFVSAADLDQFSQSIWFLHVEELKELTSLLKISDKGAKGAVIARILHFLHSGEELAMPKFPAVSCAKKSVVPPLLPKSLMLRGAYKNDLATRLFFKSLIGEYFHFTAFGIDWLNERWLQGNPPTYQEFADFWVTETERRKNTKAAPKQEWAYIRFVQAFMESYPESSRDELMQAWNAERMGHKKQVDAVVRRILHGKNS